MLRYISSLILLLAGPLSHAQTVVKGRVIDAVTMEPLAGATVSWADAHCSGAATTGAEGIFSLTGNSCRQLMVSSVGYHPQTFLATDSPLLVRLVQVQSLLQEIVVSASRGESVKRSEAPLAISVLGSKILQETKPASLDQVLNKVSGVNMVSLGNEQHQMSIRQPMTTKSLFLYLEDGIPVRTTGLFNHNALLEFNMAAVKSIEVIKGPSSSLYGSEAIGGVVNFITQVPPALPVARLSVQGHDRGYRRAELQGGFTTGRWGVAASGYYAGKHNGFLPYSDFHKATATLRLDHRLAAATMLTGSFTWVDYYSDMAAGVDSAQFADRRFRNAHTFTYRRVDALRARTTLEHQWREGSKTTATLLYRTNSIGQNPAYRVKDDYRRQGGTWTGRKDLAHGELNRSQFTSLGFTGQHRQTLGWKKAVVSGGLSLDLSPSSYSARYIRIRKDTTTGIYSSYEAPDSTLTRYETVLNNYAAFGSLEFSPLARLRMVASLRYDLFHYDFQNHLPPSSFSGAPDTVNRFRRLSPKVGITYNFSARTGVYANYSEGFVPPQVTEMYTGVQVPNLDASVFYNYEVGGWAEIIPNRLSADASLYYLAGTNEIVSVRNDDGSFANQNAGKTAHRGVELGVQATPLQEVTFRFSGAWSRHTFIRFVEKGISYNGRKMNGAPEWMYNTELWFRPVRLQGLRLGAELQHIGRYYADPQNSARYQGYFVLNLRAGYRSGATEVWVHALNALNAYYATNVSKSAYGYSYTLAEPRTFTVGVAYDFGTLLKHN